MPTLGVHILKIFFIKQGDQKERYRPNLGFFFKWDTYIFFHFQIPQLILVIFDVTYYMPKPNSFLDSYDFVVK